MKSNMIMDEQKIIPSRLKMARISRGYSLGDLESLIGISKQFLSQCEWGTANPSGSVISKLVDVLDYPLNFFLKPIINEETASAT